jgi:hypothetical protein
LPNSAGSDISGSAGSEISGSAGSDISGCFSYIKQLKYYLDIIICINI